MVEIQTNHLLAPYCTYQIGGPADFFVEVHTQAELLEALKWGEGKKVFVFGAGSNLLFDDAGFRGLVIRLRMDEIRVEGTGIAADAGVLTARVVKAAADAGLAGLEAWAGLPGTIGGAVYGNAGCFGVETKDVLKEATIYVPGEGVKTVGVEALGYGYRDSELKKNGAVVVSALFHLQAGDTTEINARMRETALLRIQKQPPGSSTGSFFKNPSPEQPAGKLIDECGLKGYQIGGAKVSDYHANFLMNAKQATAKDVLALAEHVATAVKERFGIVLQREIIFVPAE